MTKRSKKPHPANDAAVVSALKMVPAVPAPTVPAQKWVITVSLASGEIDRFTSDQAQYRTFDNGVLEVSTEGGTEVTSYAAGSWTHASYRPFKA